MLVICTDLVLVATVFGRIRPGLSSSKLPIEETSAAFLCSRCPQDSTLGESGRAIQFPTHSLVHVRLPAVLYHEIRSRMCRSLSLEPLLYDKVMKGGGLAYGHSF